MRKTLLFLAACFFFTSASAEKPVLALVVDDLGYSFELAKQVLSLPGQHTFAIIPDTTYSTKIAEFAHQGGHEIILHMPMQSLANGKNLESSTLDENMNEVEITSNVDNMLQEVPYIQGINNHMGSKLTELGYVMRPVMESIRQFNRKFYFLDSRTTALSQAYQQALQAGVPSLKRDVFLDYDHLNPESILFQFDRWLAKAKKNGYAIAIAHPYSSTIELLQQKIPEIADEFQFMTISQLLQHQQQENKSWPTYLSRLQKDLKN
jgi:polysaccharide deacetylase 2 family uncharacterized protein YibQ